MGRFRRYFFGDPPAVVAAPMEAGLYAPEPRRAKQHENWIRRADHLLSDDGVGFARWFSTQLAGKVGKVKPVIEHQLPNGEWTKDNITDVYATEFLRQLGGHLPNVSLSTLIEQAAYNRQTVGQYYLVRHDPTSYSVHSPVSATYMGSESDPNGLWKFDLDEVVHILAENSRVWRCWRPDPKMPYKATSPIRVALPDLEICYLIQRYLRRGAQSGLTARNILWIAREAMGAKLPNAAPGAPQYQIEQDYYKVANRGLTTDDTLGAVAPWMLTTSDQFRTPQIIETPFALRSEIIEAEKHAIERAARSMNAPMSLIVNEGGSSHWNEWQMDESQWEQGPEPIAKEILHVDFTVYMLRPMLETLRQRGLYEHDPERVRIGFDASSVLTSPDQSDMALELRDRGLIRAEPTVRACGFDIADMTSEEERMEIMRQSQLMRTQPRGPIDPHTRTSASRLKGQPPRQGSLAMLEPFDDEEATWLD